MGDVSTRQLASWLTTFLFTGQCTSSLLHVIDQRGATLADIRIELLRRETVGAGVPMTELTQPQAARRVTPRHSPPILDYEEVWRAHTTLVAFDISRLGDDELTALSEELETEIQLDQSDLAAKDFSRIPEQILRNEIALAEAQYDEATREMQRRARARTLFTATGVDVVTAMAPRWDAVRALDIVESLQTLGVPLRKRGREWWACCPFHDERSPSFAVNQVKGVWCCYGCQLGGDVITFIEHREHLSRGGALRFAEHILLGEVAA